MSVLSAGVVMAQPTELTSSATKSLYKTVNKNRASVHDPSVVWEPSSKRYYIFGTMRATAYTTDMQNWTGVNLTWKSTTKSSCSTSEAFVTPSVTKVKKGGIDMDFPAFNAKDWSGRGDSDWGINGNMWAPDIIWNPTMQKWCIYQSINGDSWHSSIVLLTADKITGPYLYQGPVVISGFKDSNHSFKETDLELAIGTQSSLPARYNVGDSWGRRWPHTIDPAVFYDEDGKLWLVYGSWSGGIWMLELDEETGLRDYDVSYPSTNGSSDGVTSDPYFGKKVAGGYYVSGEGPYIEHIGQYYYLFVSYGFYSPNGGYEMRVFRSTKPDGPYTDASERSAIFSNYIMNYGTGNSDTRGEKLMGAYNGWGFLTTGECAQGHNSIIAAEDGRTYLIYHTKFNDGQPDKGYHAVRVHQVFQNKQGWLVAAPFEYNSEETTSADVATKELVVAADIPGTYQLLVHKYKMDYAQMEEVTPVEITLTADGKVTGTYSGTWSREAGTSYLTLKLGATTYNGVIFEQQMDTKTIRTIAFSAMATSGVNVWGYKMAQQYALAWQLNNQKVPVSNNKLIDENIDLASLWLGDSNITLQWTSSQPAIISNHGRYNPIGLQENTDITLTAKLSTADYYWQQQYIVSAKSEQNAQPIGDWLTGMVAHYGFDDDALANSFNSDEKAKLLRKSTTKVPTIETADDVRNGNTVHLYFGANGKESYISVPNPLYGKNLDDGATISFWVKRNDNNLWDALFGVTDGTARFFLTGNAFIGYNNGNSTNYIDINNSNDVVTGYLPVGSWQFVTLCIKSTGITLYVNGTSKSARKVVGKLDGAEFTSATTFNYKYILNLLSAAKELYLGNASYWGSADVCIDDFIVHDQALSTSTRASALKKVMNRVNNISDIVTGIREILSADTCQPSGCYDLQGRRVEKPRQGLYIVNGRKTVVR